HGGLGAGCGGVGAAGSVGGRQDEAGRETSSAATADRGVVGSRDCATAGGVEGDGVDLGARCGVDGGAGGAVEGERFVPIDLERSSEGSTGQPREGRARACSISPGGT